MEVQSTIPPAQTEGQDRLCSSPAIMNEACLHCQIDASAEMPTLSTARGGKSKRFLIAHNSQVWMTRLYPPGTESKLLSWTLYGAYQPGMAALPTHHMAAEMTGFSSAYTLHACTEVCMGRASGFCLPPPL